MDEHKLNRLIAVLVLIIGAHYVLDLILPYLIYGTGGLVIWRVWLFYRRNRT